MVRLFLDEVVSLACWEPCAGGAGFQVGGAGLVPVLPRERQRCPLLRVLGGSACRVGGVRYGGARSPLGSRCRCVVVFVV